jgi:dTDP-4-amino-4,6-dideoxygalactose transaminase
METIMHYAKSFGADVLEDCSQAHGAKCNGKQVGTFGDIAAFSCYPGKNLGAAGQAGVITTDDDLLAERCKEIKEVGSKVKYIHNIKGGNYRLDPIQAIVLDEKLKHLDKWNAKRREFAEEYRKISNEEITVPLIDPAPWCTEQVFHVFPILVETGVERQEIMEFIQNKGSQCGIHYPICIEETGAYRELGTTNFNPITRRNAERLVSLPIHPFMLDGDCQSVVEILNRWKSEKKEYSELAQRAQRV